MRTSFSDPVWQKPKAAPAFQSALSAAVTLDAVIVGGGIMGLSTALHAARAGL
ncbi:FAD-dependent oxidoreductase [Mesorhizobium sp. M2D.F.Ca.ET.140.01.1.1]|nr:FAD-dependent oxidoreductase [Mesorhizobium sp. M2D.F.Ca.ET.140.01.1.1]